MKHYHPGQIALKVSNESVTVGKLLPAYFGALQELSMKVSKNASPEAVQRLAMRKALDGYADMLLLYCDAINNVPPEMLERAEVETKRMFEEKQVPEMMKRANVQTRAQLAALMAKEGANLEDRLEDATKQNIAQMWRSELVKIDPNVSRQDLLQYYWNHEKDFDHTGIYEFEELAVDLSEVKDKHEGWAKICAMGRMVLSGKSVSEVALQYSDGPTAKDGGRRKKGDKQDLPGEVLNAIEKLPIGQLSDVIEGSYGFYIIRVTKRLPPGKLSFADAQVEIKNRIYAERQNKKMEEILAHLRRDYRVWSILDEIKAAENKRADRR